MKKNIVLLIGFFILCIGIIFWQESSSVKAAIGTSNWSAATSGGMVIFNDVQVLASSSNRTYSLICNDSSNVIYLNANQDKPAQSGSGIRLNANGGCYEINVDNLYTGAIRATSSASSNITVVDYKYQN